MSLVSIAPQMFEYCKLRLATLQKIADGEDRSQCVEDEMNYLKEIVSRAEEL